MKILKHGNIPIAKKLSYKVTCPSCGCEFVIDDDEIETRERRLDGVCTIHCPDCDSSIQFNREHCIYEDRKKG